WKTGMAVPRDIAVAYLLQGSFYGHSIYATLYLDAWRKDSVVMLIHHVVTLVLIISSYAFRCQSCPGPRPQGALQYIVAFAAKVLTGQVRELKDVREYDTAEALSPKPSKAE
ncbi:hypothetical protein E2I00_018643, partial [Balaenoptera physalus]